MASAQVNAKLGMEVARDFRATIAPDGFVAKDDAGDLDFAGQPAAARVGEARVMVADNPGPVEAAGEIGEQRASVRWQPVTADAVVEAVAEAEEPSRAGLFDDRGERAQRRLRIIGREELPEPRVPARLFEVQIGDQQRIFRAPEERAVGRRLDYVARERKGNLEPGLTPAHWSI
jgi:hypothetical protein